MEFSFLEIGIALADNTADGRKAKRRLMKEDRRENTRLQNIAKRQRLGEENGKGKSKIEEEPRKEATELMRRINRFSWIFMRLVVMKLPKCTRSGL